MDIPNCPAWECLFPSQAFWQMNYQSKDSYEENFYNLFMSVLNVSNPHDKFLLQESDLFTITQMASGPLLLQLLQFLIHVTGAKNVLEIGTFIGLSAMYFAEAVPEDGSVVTIEKFQDFADIAKINFRNNKFEDKIKLIVGDAFSLLETGSLEPPFDLIFIDGNKENYAHYLEFSLELASEKGIIVIDNATFQGDVFNSPPTTPKGVGVLACLEKIKGLSDWESSLLPFNDGVIVLRKIATS